MFTERSGKQMKLEMVVLEELVPRDHLLRKIDASIDFSFINKICKPYYCENNGRPAEYIDDLNKAINAYPSLEIGFVSGLRETRFFVPLLFFCFLRGRYLRISGLSVRQRI